MAVLAPPVQVVTDGAPPFVQVPSGAPPFVVTTGPAPPITIVASGAPPITLFNEDGSLWSAAAPAAPANTVLPVISGTAMVGQTISATTGTWTGSPTPTYAYQWKRAGASIGGATASTYLLVVLDTGALITVTVTATNSEGSASATSPSFGMIDPAAAPVLSSASAVDFSDIFVWGQATTDTASGTLYAVVVASAAATPTAAQIVAGTDAAGAAAPNASVAITSTGVKQVLVRGLTAVTAYKVCMTHRLVGQASNVVTGSFTTDTLVASFATNGLATGMGPSTGCGAFGTNIADPYGGTNAVRFVDNNSLTANQVVFSCGITFFNGVNKAHITVKHQGGAQWLRQSAVSVSVSGVSAYFNTLTGAVGNIVVFSPTPVIFDVGSGWKMFSGQVNLAGADVTGTWNINKTSVDNVLTIPSLDGTHIQDLYNIRITRV